MKKYARMLIAAASIAVSFGVTAETSPVGRTIPQPLPSHPGNIFVAGETVVIPLTANVKTWRAADYDGKIAAQGESENGKANLGKLPVGYYEVTAAGAGNSNRITVGVLEPLHAPTPLDSPIGIDVALAWCFPREQWRARSTFANWQG